MFEEIVLLPATRHIGLGADPSLPERVEREKLGKVKMGTRYPDGKGRGRVRRHEDSYPISEQEFRCRGNSARHVSLRICGSEGTTVAHYLPSTFGKCSWRRFETSGAARFHRAETNENGNAISEMSLMSAAHRHDLFVRQNFQDFRVLPND